VVAAEDFENPLETFLQIRRCGERLAGFEQRRQLPDFARMGGVRFHPVRKRAGRHGHPEEEEKTIP
jgi:hypothetical protein